MHIAQCTTHNAQCTMHNAPCPFSYLCTHHLSRKVLREGLADSGNRQPNTQRSSQRFNKREAPSSSTPRPRRDHSRPRSPSRKSSSYSKNPRSSPPSVLVPIQAPVFSDWRRLKRGLSLRLMSWPTLPRHSQLQIRPIVGWGQSSLQKE